MLALLTGVVLRPVLAETSAGTPACPSLQFGAEVRVRGEFLDAPAYGLAGVPAYTASGVRSRGHAQWCSASGVSAFVELSVATERGRRPAERSFDRSALDIAQASIAWRGRVAGTEWGARVGRQELDAHGNRLIAVRDAASLRRSFDLVWMSAERGGLRVEAWTGRPVANGPGSFDDRANRQERFRGLDLAWRRSPEAARTWGLFMFDRQIGALPSGGEERRQTYGVRWTRRATTWDGAAQASVQRGHRNGSRVRAHGIAAEVGRTWVSSAWQPRWSLSGGWASGDASSSDREVGTFDVLYPNLGYFTAAPLNYPGNNADLRPQLTVWPRDGTRIQIGADVVWRLRRTDAVYGPPGIAIAAPGAGSGSHVATLFEVRATHRISPRGEVTVGAVYAGRGRVLRETSARDARFADAQITFKW